MFTPWFKGQPPMTRETKELLDDAGEEEEERNLHPHGIGAA